MPVMSNYNIHHTSVLGWRFFPGKIYGVRTKSDLFWVYTIHILHIFMHFTCFGFMAELPNKQGCSSNHASERACTDHYRGGGACFTQK
jgi:hypothetical protein